MFWYSVIELDSLLSLLMIIVYGLFSLRSVNVHLADVYFFCRLYPVLFVLGYYMDSSAVTVDVLLAVLLLVVMYSFKSFESVLLLLFAFIGSYFMLHSVDLLTFYVALEAQNFSFLVLCGLLSTKDSSSFSMEAALKYFLLSAFSSGVLLFWFSTIYLQTGLSVLSLASSSAVDSFQSGSVGLNGQSYIQLQVPYSHLQLDFMILAAMMFKLGAAPLHLWMVQIFSSVKRSLLMYISTAPKLALFGFWVSGFQAVWTDFSVLLFAVFSVVLGSFGAYSQPALRAVFAYSSVNEMGLMLLALETAGFGSLFQHLGIYVVSQVLLWNLDDKRLLSVVAVSLAALPPLAGFFGKAWIFWAAISAAVHSNLVLVLVVALFCSGVSLVYYLRVLRLFWNNSKGSSCRLLVVSRPRSSIAATYAPLDSRVMLIATCVVLLAFLPVFLIKPFVL